MVEEQLIFQNGVIYSKVFKIEATIINKETRWRPYTGVIYSDNNHN